ncbi:MAG: hypothetical protein ACPGWR_26860 [Ardenticatenaceae bacterium]
MNISRRKINKAGLMTLLIAMVISLSSVLYAKPPSDGPTPLPPVGQNDPFFGIVQGIHDPDKAVAAGSRWERLVVWWSSFQPNGPDDWVPEAWIPIERVEGQKTRGIELVGVVLHTPTWVARDTSIPQISPPKNLDLPFDHPDNYWGQFAARLAAEYAGTIDTWILWNEPDMYNDELVMNWNGSLEEFARMQVVGYQAIKKANPNAKVVLTGTTYWWDLNNRPFYLDLLFPELKKAPGAAENGNFFDAVSVHQYSNPLNSYTVPVTYRRILEKHGIDKPLWMVESNVVPHDDPIAPLPRDSWRASLEEQASYMIQSVALARAAGVERFSVYKMFDDDNENGQYFGLVRSDGTPRPAYVAYQTAVRELSNVRDVQYFWSDSASPPTEDELTALVAASATYRQFIWPGPLNVVRMKRGADRVTVLWNVTAEPLEVGVPSSVAQAKVINKYGQERSIERNADGAFHLTLAAATNNTDHRNSKLILTGGEPVILVEAGAAEARDGLPRVRDACWGVSGATVPANPTNSEAWVAPTGYAVSGEWLEFFRGNGDVDYIGYPRSPVMVDPLNGKQCVQYFQRIVLEWHPENEPAFRLQRRLLAQDLIDEPAETPSEAEEPNSEDYWYFPKGPNGFGHAVSNIVTAADGTEINIGFKEYFDTHGKENAFGYPMAPPKRQVAADGSEQWTQRFQAAVFEYHPQFDKDGNKPGTDLPWRTWKVQLQLLGDEYIKDRQVPLIIGDPAKIILTPPEPTP